MENVFYRILFDRFENLPVLPSKEALQKLLEEQMVEESK